MRELREQYPTVFHYTNLKGLEGILTNQTLWATHYKFLNDSEELVLFKPVFKSLLKPLIGKWIREREALSAHSRKQIKNAGGVESTIEKATNEMSESLYKILNKEKLCLGFYVTSFCGQDSDSYIVENGLLSQWRAYGSSGGYALEFDTALLEDLMDKEGERYSYLPGFIGNAVYSDDKKKIEEEFGTDLSKLKEFSSTFLEFDNSKTEKSILPALQAFINCAGRYKHRGFKEEHEVRLGFTPVNVQDEQGKSLLPQKPVHFVVRKEISVPYIELFGKSYGLNLPIRRIIVGPHIEKTRRAESLKYFLSVNKLSHIQVTVSDIPYIG